MRLLIILLLATSSLYAQTTSVIVGVVGENKTNPTPIPPTPGAYTYYADDSNAGAGDGSEGNPFQDPQDALDIITAGQSLYIAAGTYRQTLRPTNSGTSGNPITITLHANAIISGLNEVNTTWTNHSGDIWRTTISVPQPNYQEDNGGSNTQIMAIQVFKDDVPIIHARYPNINSYADLFDRNYYRNVTQTAGMNVDNIQDNGLLPFGNLTSGYFFIQGWFLTTSRVITSTSGNRSNFASLIVVNGEQFRKFYYVTNKLSLLDQQNEFHYEGGVLYVWQTGGGSPTEIQYKARNWGFDLQNRSYINITGGQLFACEVMGNSGTDNVIVDGINAKYINHNLLVSNPGGEYTRAADQTGIRLSGDNCVLKNSRIEWAASQGVWLGQAGRLENNWMEHIGYLGMFGGSMKAVNGTGSQVITRNTFKTNGRGAIELQNTDAHNLDISYNDFSRFNAVSYDGAAVYSQALRTHTGTRIHHNAYHSPLVVTTAGLNGVQINGNYFDQASGGDVTIDHNVHYDRGVCEADFYAEINNTQPGYGQDVSVVSGPFKLYNNVMANTDRPYISYANCAVGPIQRNNIYRGDLSSPNEPLNVAFSLLKNVNPLFVGGAGHTAYRVGLGSPAIGAGTVIPGITPTSNVTIGAFQFGEAAWTCGCDTTTNTLCVD